MRPGAGISGSRALSKAENRHAIVSISDPAMEWHEIDLNAPSGLRAAGNWLSASAVIRGGWRRGRSPKRRLGLNSSFSARFATFWFTVFSRLSREEEKS